MYDARMHSSSLKLSMRCIKEKWLIISKIRPMTEKGVIMTVRLPRVPLYRNSFFLGSTSVLIAASGFIFWTVAAKIYTLEEVGLATALISSLGIVNLFSRLGFDFSIIRFFPTNDRSKIVGTSLITTTIASLLVGIIFIYFSELLIPNLDILIVPEYAFIFLLIVTMNSVESITGRVFIAERKSEHYFYQNIFMSLRIPLLILLSFLGTWGIVCSFGLAFMMASIFGLMSIKRILTVRELNFDMEFINRSLKFSSWNYISNILSLMPTLILPIIVLKMLGEAEAAKYYIAFAIANVVLIIPQSLGTSLFVEGSYGEGLKKSVMRALKINLALMIPIVLVLFFFGDRFLRLLHGEYLEAFQLLRVLVLTGFFVSVYSLFISIQNIRMKPESVVKINALRCLMLLVLSYFFVQQYGILGIGLGWMITYGVIFLWIVLICRWEGWV